MSYAIIVLGLFLMLQGCNGNREPTRVPGTIAEPGKLTEQTFVSSGTVRDYHLYLPENPENAPIVLLLHGQSGSSTEMLALNGSVSPFRVWLDIALEQNLILVVPTGLRGSNDKTGWNDCRNDAQITPNSDDVGFLDDLVEHVGNTHSSTSSDVFAVGISSGGLMAMRLADEIPGKIDAMAIIIASRPVNSKCPESSIPVPVLFMNGTDDELLPYYGGQIIANRGEVYSTPDTVNYWINRNLTEASPTQTALADIDQTDDSTATRYSYRNSDGKIVVELYEIANGGHTEPSISERYSPVTARILGNQNGDIEMADEVWKFLEQI